MKKSGFLVLLFFFLHCHSAKSDLTNSDDNDPDTLIQKTYPGKINFEISGVHQEANIISAFYLTSRKNFILEFITEKGTGFAGYLMFDQLKVQSAKWQPMADSINGFIYEKFTGFDPDYEVRYYGISDSGFSEISRIQNDTIYGNFLGVLKTTKELGIFPKRIEISNGTFKVKNKVDTVNFSFGYF